MFKFKRNTKKIINDMQVTLDDISDDLDDIRSDLNELHETVKEGLRLTLQIQEQCQELIEMMEKNNNDRGMRNVG